MRRCAIAVVAALALAGCGTTDSPGAAGRDRPNDASPPPTSQTRTDPPAKRTAPQRQAAQQLRFTATTLDGDSFDGRSLAGRPAVLWFWAPWCPVCNREAPGIAAAAAEYGDRVTFVGVAAQDQLPAMREFAAKHRLDSFVHLNDERADVWARFGVTYQPAFAFISADGDVDVVKEPLPESELDAKLEALAG
ncbi:MAG: redoxin family protein [Thermocrispum sp.]